MSEVTIERLEKGLVLLAWIIARDGPGGGASLRKARARVGGDALRSGKTQTGGKRRNGMIRRHLNAQQLEELIALRRAGVTVRAIAELFGFSYLRTVEKILARHGVKVGRLYGGRQAGRHRIGIGYHF
jgi:hypothetical protein